MTTPRLPRVARMAAVVLGVLLAGAAVAHGIVWWQAVGLLEREAARWIAARGAEGLVVRHAPPARGGWPRAARLTLPDLRAEAEVAVERQGSVPIRIVVPALSIEVALLRPREARVTVGTPLTLAAAPGITLSAEAEAMQMLLRLRGGGDDHSRMLARGLVVRTGHQRFSADLFELGVHRDPSARGEGPALALTLAAAGVQLPATAGAPLGDRIGRAELDLQLVGSLPGVGSPRAQAIAWRDAGGFVQVPRLLLDWGPLSLSADATLALDQAVQPSGAGRARMAGLGQTLEALAAAGVIPRQTAQAGRSIIAFMQRTPAGGGPPVVELPLTLQDRTLSAGRLTLLRLPPIAWPP